MVWLKVQLGYYTTEHELLVAETVANACYSGS